MFARIGALSLAVLVAVPAYGQEYRGQLRGRVVLADGKPGAAVPMLIINEATGESRRFESNDRGRYAVVGLLPGYYRIEAADDRHRPFAIRTKVLMLQELDLDLRLGVATITATGDVPTAAPIDRFSHALATRLDSSFLTRLPLDGRNYLDLVVLAPGAASGSSGIVSNGTGERSTAYLLDGSYNMDPRGGASAAHPQLDAIAEMDIRSSGYGASFGRAAGAQVNVVTKSGTNRPSGGVLGFFQTDVDRSQLGAFAGGPLALNRTFLFGNYQHSRASDAVISDSGHLLGLRLDHGLNRTSRVAARYGLDDKDAFDRRGQNAGASLHSVWGGALANELRWGLSRVESGSRPSELLNVSDSAYQLANASTWAGDQHLVTAGAEWFGFRPGDDRDARAGDIWGVFVQDEWRVLPSVSVSVGLRYDRSDAGGSLPPEGGSHASPRLGFAWTVGRDAQVAVRGGYGVHHDFTSIEDVSPRVDRWSLGVQRQVGRGRTLEAAYLASRADDLLGRGRRTRYDGLQLEAEQRSEVGLAGVLAYTYGKWTEDERNVGLDIRAPLDARHRVSFAFVGSLPWGVDRRWLTQGLAAAIFGQTELSGIVTLQSGRPIPGVLDHQGPSHRNLDAALLKNISLGDRRSLQLRFETFNVANRVNLPPGRRYQVGGRLVF